MIQASPPNLPSRGSNPLLVNTSRSYSSVRTQTAAVREFLKTGVSAQGPTASTLQAILDHCFAHNLDFNLQWKAETASFTVVHEHRRSRARIAWEAEGRNKDAEPVLLKAQLGIFHATLSHTGGGWRLQIAGNSFQLQATTLRAAKAEANTVLEERITHARSVLER